MDRMSEPQAKPFQSLILFILSEMPSAEEARPGFVGRACSVESV